MFNVLGRRRTRTEKLVNAGIEVIVGGKGNGREKRVVIKEPSIDRQNKHLALFVRGIAEVFENNPNALRRIKERLDGYDTNDNERIAKMLDGIGGDLPELAPIVKAASAIVCDLIDESDEYIAKDMSYRQLIQVVDAYITVIGVDVIKECFLSLAGMWKTANKVISLPRSPQSPPQSEKSRSI